MEQYWQGPGGRGERITHLTTIAEYKQIDPIIMGP